MKMKIFTNIRTKYLTYNVPQREREREREITQAQVPATSVLGLYTVVRVGGGFVSLIMFASVLFDYIFPFLKKKKT